MVVAVITPDQISAARRLLRWTQQHLAIRAGVSVPTVSAAESGFSDTRRTTLDAIQTAMEAGGIIFLSPGDTRDGGPGVRLK